MAKKEAGQAVVEYIIVFAFLAMISIAMTNAIRGFMGNTAGSLGFQLTNHLSAGVCAEDCFNNSFTNGMGGTP